MRQYIHTNAQLKSNSVNAVYLKYDKSSHHLFMDRNGNVWRVQPENGKVSRFHVSNEAEFRDFRARVLSVHHKMSNVNTQGQIRWVHFERTTAKLTRDGKPDY